MLQIASFGLRRILVAGLVIGAFGCGKEDDDKVTTELEGTWNRACQAGTGDDEGTSEKETVSFTGMSSELTVTSYSDADCTTESMRIVLSNSFTIGDEVAEPAGARAVDLKTSGLSFTLLTDAMVEAMNAANYCGGGFVKGTAKTITADTCDDASIKAAFNDSFDLYKLTDGKLYLGDKEVDTNYDGTTAAKRPRALESAGFTKQ